MVVCELRNPADIASLAVQGIGVAMVPRSAAADVVPRELATCVLRLNDPLATQPVCLVHLDPEPTGAPTQAFINSHCHAGPSWSRPREPEV